MIFLRASAFREAPRTPSSTVIMQLLIGTVHLLVLSQNHPKFLLQVQLILPSSPPSPLLVIHHRCHSNPSSMTDYMQISTSYSWSPRKPIWDGPYQRLSFGTYLQEGVLGDSECIRVLGLEFHHWHLNTGQCFEVLFREDRAGTCGGMWKASLVM